MDKLVASDFRRRVFAPVQASCCKQRDEKEPILYVRECTAILLCSALLRLQHSTYHCSYQGLYNTTMKRRKQTCEIARSVKSR